MNRQDIERHLEEMRFGNLPSHAWHKQQLRAALVQYAGVHHPSVFAWMRQTFKRMSMNFRISSFVVGAMVGVLVLSGARVVNNSVTLAKYNPFASKTAEAQAVLKDVLFKASKLSPEQVKDIETKMQADMKASLEEAMAAPDLQIVEGDEAQQMTIPDDGQKGHPIALYHAFPGLINPDEQAPAPTGGDKVAMSQGMMVNTNGNIKITKRLSYTDPRGYKVILGIGEDGLPMFKAVTLTSEDWKKMQTQPGEAGQSLGPIGFPPEQTFHTEIQK